ncbi:MepB family protein [Staphylococcus caprae]|uniref:MepB family protein n=1 Tax=Staphylococcus caprae TaxID=29380 RepID=UPI003B223ACB
MNLKSVEILNHLSKCMDLNYNIISEEQWNTEYEAMDLKLNHTFCKSRLAKKTPKKSGYFVTLWIKDKTHINQPFDYQNFPEKLIVNVIDNYKRGQFVFSKDLLLKKGILSHDEKKGKMAFRVYPVWETNLNTTALKTQKWQCNYFIDLTKNIKKELVLSLYE